MSQLPSTKRSPRLTDIANKAGVSVASVSRYINQPQLLSDELIKRIRSAADMLGYVEKNNNHQPDLQNLGNNKVGLTNLHHTLAILITDSHNLYLADLILGAQQEAALTQFQTIVIHAGHDLEKQLAAQKWLSILKPQGVIVSGTDLSGEEWVQFYEDTHIPLVLENIRVHHPHIFCIAIDFETTGRRITQYLMDLGHTKIGYIAGPATAEHSLARRRGIEQALNEHGFALQTEYCPDVPNSFEGAIQGATHLINLPEERRPTAIIVYNDMLSLGVLHATQTHRLRIPEDMSIISFDDVVIAAHTRPALTTVSLPAQRIGTLAVQWLKRTWANMPDQAPQGGLTLLESRLVIRESTGVANSRL
jgi:LacI family transcriptional regulator